jgi:putative transposase
LQINRSYWDKYKHIKTYDDIIDNDEKWKQIILHIFNGERKEFGYRRITAELNDRNIRHSNNEKVGERFVRRIMHKYDIRPLYVRKMMRKARFRATNTSVNYPDLIKRNYHQIKNRFTVLYTDITYLISHGKTSYKSTIIDAATREVIASDISSKPNAKFVVQTLKRAISIIGETKSLNDVVIHSDHGVQYTSHSWKQVCDTYGLIISMGTKKTCADNIVIENYHSLLKKGTIHNHRYESHDEYIRDVLSWDRWYNSKKSPTTMLTTKQINNHILCGQINLSVKNTVNLL